MTEDSEPSIKDLVKRIDALEKELADKRATDAYLFLMIKDLSGTLMGMLDTLRLSFKKEPVSQVQETARKHAVSYESNSAEAEKLIWGEKGE